LWGWLEVERKQLELLKKEYNIALARFNKMEKWCETASHEEQEKQYKNIVGVINTCNNLLSKIKSTGYLPTSNEILNGFL